MMRRVESDLRHQSDAQAVATEVDSLLGTAPLDRKARISDEAIEGLLAPTNQGGRKPRLTKEGLPMFSKRRHSQNVEKLLENQNWQEEEKANFIVDLAYGGSAIPQKPSSRFTPRSGLSCPPSKVKEWKSIDCHLHLLDFLQKSSGTQAALKAMEGCNVERAVVFGMPCCKKWTFYRPEQPLYYQDDNGPCYVYAYADQMVADAWLALDDNNRKRFAPCFASFDPTDLAAISHVRRMYNKYPKMWRGLGEVMCRHDDLTNMLMGKEIPRVNHDGLDPIYEFCVEVDLPCLVHHNSGRVGDISDGSFYLHEVEDVLERYPTLKFVWVHAGASRGCSQPEHHSMIDKMLTKYPNLTVDISWVIWEECICDDEGVVKDGWVECIEKHNTKVFIGSDNVAQFFPIKDTSVNLLAVNITKYWQLFDKLTPEAAENVSYMNAYRRYFEKWDVPSGGLSGRYQRTEAYYDCEALDPNLGEFVVGQSVLDDGGKY